MTAAPRRLLILGGTGDARQLAERLQEHADVTTISSLAGRVAQPALPPGRVRIGGFGGTDGLVAYLRDERIDAVIDATHPFAATMSAHAAAACTRVNVPLLAFTRPAWSPVAGDRWYPARDSSVAAALAPTVGTRIFLTIGRQELAPFATCADRWFLIRAIDPPDTDLPPNCTLLLRRGPFSVDEEIALMRAYAIDALVSKNSGGAATAAKITASRALHIPVVMVQRPPRPNVPSVASLRDALTWALSGCRDADPGE